MKLYKCIVLIIVLLFLAATSTYIIFTGDMFMENEPEINENTVNAIRETVL